MCKAKKHVKSALAKRVLINPNPKFRKLVSIK